jgi:hypothetical protein
LTFKREAQEVPALAWFGMSLAALHLVSLYFWWSAIPAFTSTLNGFCWPAFPACESLRPFSYALVFGMRAAYLTAALAAGGLFGAKKWIPAWWALLACEAIKLFIFAQDFRFMGNYHYILFMFGFVFLFLPKRISVIPALWVLVYVSAGALKLNAEWISGAAFRDLPPWGDRFLPELQTYVIFIEVVIAWLLLSRTRAFFWIAVFHLACFHAASYFIVGFYYPVICFVILGILVWYARERFPLPRPQGRAAWVFLLLFVLAQVRFHLASSDGALTGVGRLGALNMFDVNSDCEAYAELESSKGIRIEVSTTPKGEAMRIQCDPVIFANFAHQICAQVQRGEMEGRQLLFQAYSRRSSDWTWRRIYNLKTDCRSGVSLVPQGES